MADCVTVIPGGSLYAVLKTPINGGLTLNYLMNNGFLAQYPGTTFFVYSNNQYFDLGLMPGSCGSSAQVLLTNAEYAEYMTLKSVETPDPFDSQTASQLWWGGFSIVLLCYLSAYGVGMALKLLNSAAKR